MYVKNAMTLADAKQIAAAAEAEALKNNWRVTIAVLDDGGNLLFLQRLDESPLGSIVVAQPFAHFDGLRNLNNAVHGLQTVRPPGPALHRQIRVAQDGLVDQRQARAGQVHASAELIPDLNDEIRIPLIRRHFNLRSHRDLAAQGQSVNQREGEGETQETVQGGRAEGETLVQIEDPGRAQRLFVPFVRPFLKTPVRGATTSIHLASCPDLEQVSGRYFANSKPKKSSKRSYDEATAARLWQVSTDLVLLSAAG